MAKRTREEWSVKQTSNPIQDSFVRLGEAEHIYQTVRFIVENDYVNGTVLEIDGGLAI